jgi:hypothetical protein
MSLNLLREGCGLHKWTLPILNPLNQAEWALQPKNCSRRSSNN